MGGCWTGFSPCESLVDRAGRDQKSLTAVEKALQQVYWTLQPFDFRVNADGVPVEGRAPGAAYLFSAPGLHGTSSILLRCYLRGTRRRSRARMVLQSKPV